MANLKATLEGTRISYAADFCDVRFYGNLEKDGYYRLKFRENRGWQTPSQFDWHPQAWPLKGGHGTTSVGAAGILVARQIVPPTSSRASTRR